MTKNLSQAAIFSLENALSVVFWYKNDLKKFLERCLNAHPAIIAIDWNTTTKRNIASETIRKIHPTRDGADYLLKLCDELCAFDSFPHLKNLEDSDKKILQAKEAVASLRRLLHNKKSDDDTLRARTTFTQKLKTKEEHTRNLEELKNSYYSLAASSNPQQRGLQLETFMKRLFDLYALDPHASFTLGTEQIDGSFTLESTDYIFEAKWEKGPISRSQLDIFQAKISRKLDNTLGLFLSISGFSNEGLLSYKNVRTGMILMDGQDLMAVLDERIDFTTLLIKKRKHGARTGEIFISYSEIEH